MLLPTVLKVTLAELLPSIPGDTTVNIPVPLVKNSHGVFPDSNPGFFMKLTEAVTVSLALLLVTLPTEFDTFTLKLDPLSTNVAAGVV